jgi:hypothetical protein
MSRLDTVTSLGLIVFMLVCAAISGGALLLSVRSGEVISAWGWAALFVVTSLVAAWRFWSLP